MANKKKITDIDQLSALFEQEIDKEFPERKENKALAKKLKSVFDNIVGFKLSENEKILDKLKSDFKAEFDTKVKSESVKKNAFQNEVINRKNNGRIVGPDNVAHVIMSRTYDYIKKDPKNEATHKLRAKRLLERLDKPVDKEFFAGVGVS